jgi:DNA-binding transcriptional LysR family regulator
MNIPIYCFEIENNAMLDLDDVRAFVRVADLGNFTRAAEQLGAPKSRVSLQVKALEAALCSRLLQRTTRAVRLTPDGDQFLGRARALLDEAEELAAMFQATSTLRGRVRLDVPIALAREAVIPRLPELFALHPHLELALSTTDRRVDVVRDGFDLVLRVGSLADSGLVARQVGAFTMANAASPAYLRKYGLPRSPDDLGRHFLVHYSPRLTDEPSFEYRAGGRDHTRPMKSLVTVNGTDAYTGACLAGLGIIQSPRYGLGPRLRRGELVEVLPEFTCAPMPVSIVHAHGKAVPKRVRAVMTWLAQAVEAALA